LASSRLTTLPGTQRDGASRAVVAGATSTTAAGAAGGLSAAWQVDAVDAAPIRAVARSAAPSARRFTHRIVEICFIDIVLKYQKRAGQDTKGRGPRGEASISDLPTALRTGRVVSEQRACPVCVPPWPAVGPQLHVSVDWPVVMSALLRVLRGFVVNLSVFGSKT
jgi:hypothetical protein